MPTIQRVKIQPVEESLENERHQLALKAQSVLGYNRLAKVIATPSALAYQLRKLGIEPLVQSGVQDYKRRKARPGMWSGHKAGIGWMAMALIVAGVLVPRLNSQTNHWTVGSLAAVGVVALCILSAIFTIVALCMWLDSNNRGHRTTKVWRTRSLSEYAHSGGNIPEFALRKAIQLKEALPQIELRIDQLMIETERHERPDKDPFLVAELDNEKYWIDVWDEKDYEAVL